MALMYYVSNKQRDEELRQVINGTADFLKSRSINIAEALWVLEHTKDKIKTSKISDFIDPGISKNL